MAVVLRLTRVGYHNAPFYRIVAANKTRPRDGKFLEIVGTYDPVRGGKAVLKEERIKHWISVGAVPSLVVRSVLRRNVAGFIEGLEKHKSDKVLAARRARKQRARARDSKKK